MIPNHPNHTWIDPQETGVYLGQCAQYCGVQHAKMLLRVYVDSPEQFNEWVQEQKKPAVNNDTVAEGRRIFETTACVNCHAVTGTIADGHFGPDLTHLMSRDTIASGAAPNTLENLRAWISQSRLDQARFVDARDAAKRKRSGRVTAYLLTLR